MKQLSTQIPGNLRNEGRIKKEKVPKIARKWLREQIENGIRKGGDFLIIAHGFFFDQLSLKANFLVFIKRNSQGRRGERNREF